MRQKSWACFLLSFFSAAAAAGGAFLLQSVAFPASGSSAQQISATVYVEKLPAQVNLQSTFTPGAASNNLSITVKAIGPTKAPDPWLLVVQCAEPSGKPYPQAVPLISESPVDTQPMGNVLVVESKPTKKPQTFNFTCFTGLASEGQTAETVVQDRDLNLSLPVLEQNPFAQSGLAGAPLYAEKAGGKYKDVVEVEALPGAPCPPSTPSPSPPPSTTGSSSPPAGTPPPSPTATSSSGSADN